MSVVAALILAACTTNSTSTTPHLPAAQVRVPAEVMNVVDGDTIDVLIDGTEVRLRYIGIDTPETVYPAWGEEPYGREASARNRALVSGKTVYLEKDVSETDRYGRLLRYVWLDDDTMVNAVLVAEGYAQVSTYLPRRETRGRISGTATGGPCGGDRFVGFGRRYARAG